MSRLFPRIPKEISHRLPWQALLGLFDVETITGLESVLKLKDGTLSKASRGFYGSAGSELARGLSANVHQALLENMATRFSSADQMRCWMERHWPETLLCLTGDALEALYEAIDLAHQIHRIGTFPTDYIERNEKGEILHLLLNNKQVQVLWITGPGGSGKSTLALSLVRRDWERLKKHYEKIFWVNGEQANYADGLRQIAESLEWAEQSVGIIEQKLRSLTRRSKVLFILDDLQDVPGLIEWQQLAGSLGKLLVTSRTRLAENELRANSLFHQIQLGGFSLEQGRQFFMDTTPAMDVLVEKTGGLPLALRILSGLKLELGYSAQEIQTRLEQFALDALEYPASQDSRETSLRFCFDISFHSLAKNHPQAAQYFECAGVFQSRTILKTLLDDVAVVENALVGDKLTSVLLRYNLVDVVNIKGERFIQLHPLLHAFAREKLARLTGENAFDQRYNEAIYAWVCRIHSEVLNGFHRLSHQIHVLDILHVLDCLMGEQQWQKVIWVFKLTFELFVIDNPSEGKPYQLISFIEARLPGEDLPEIILLRVMLSHRKSVPGILKPDLIQRGSLLELAHNLGKSIEPIERLDYLYWQERSQVLMEMIEWLKGEGRDAEVFALLNSEETALVFSNNSPNLSVIQQANIFQKANEYEKALNLLQSADAMSEAKAGNRIEFWYLLQHQAECYEKLGQFGQAIQLYENLLAETDSQTPAIFRTDFGQSLARLLRKEKRYVQMEQTLDIIDEILVTQQDDTLFNYTQLKIWDYRIESRRALEDPDGALAYARKAFSLAGKLDLGDKKTQLQQLIVEFEAG